MSSTGLAKIILNTALNWYVKPILNEETRDKFFPEPLDKLILAEVKSVSKKIDEVKDEIARLRIQPSLKAFNKQIDFYKKTVIPIIREECGKDNPNIERLTELAEKLDSHCIDFSGDISNAWQVIHDKCDSFDFSVRVLFGLTRDMNSLYLAMLSWTRGLFSIIPGKSYKISTYDNYIKTCLDETPVFSDTLSSSLASSRLNKIKFHRKIQTQDEWEGSYFIKVYHKVDCLYIDSFSSSEKKDPFFGPSVHKKVKKELGFFTLKITMAKAAIKAGKYEKEYHARQEETQKLLNEHVISPNKEFLKLWADVKKNNKKVLKSKKALKARKLKRYNKDGSLPYLAVI